MDTEPTSASPSAPAVKAPPRGRKRRVAMVVVGVGLLVALVFGLPYYLHARQYESTDDAFVEAQVIPISPKVGGIVAEVNIRDNQPVQKGQLLVQIDDRDYAARKSQAEAALAAARAGVKSSQAAHELAKQTYEATVNQATAALAGANAAVETASLEVEVAKQRLAESDARVAADAAQAEQNRAEVVASEAERVRAETELDRVSKMSQSLNATGMELTNATAVAKSAVAHLEASQKKVAAADARINQSKAARQGAASLITHAESHLAESRAKLEEAKARLALAKAGDQQVAVAAAQAENAKAQEAAAQAALKQSELDLSYASIVAPVDGRIARKTVEPGSLLQPGQLIFTIVAGQPWVIANFKETQLTDMRPGQEAHIHVDAYPSMEIRGKVDSIQPGTGSRFSVMPPENATGNYVKVVQRVPVKIVLDETPDADHLLAPGMSVVPEVKVK